MLGQIEDIEVFVAVVAEGSFSGAARRLNRTPSAVSKQVARLEEQMQTRLLNRTTRQLALTGEGSYFYDRIRPLLDSFREIEGELSEMGQVATGKLRITCAVSFGEEVLFPLLPKFLDAHPQVQIDLDMTDNLVDLTAGGYDVGVRATPSPPLAMVARRLAENRRIVCASPAYLAEVGRPETPADVADHNCILLDTVQSWQTWPFFGPQGPITVEVKGRFQTNNGRSMKKAALAGMGLARLAAFNVGEEIQDGSLVPVLTDYERSDGSSILLVYHPERRNVPKVRAFVDFVMAEAPARMPWLQDPELLLAPERRPGQVF